MDNILYEMRPALARYANVVAQVAKVGVTVIDDKLVRMFYLNSKWKLPIGVSMAETGHIVKATLDTGRPQMMLEPYGHPACKTCKNRATCMESVEMWAPIILNGVSLGVIGFICETQEQQERISRDCTTYVAFLQQVADLIGLEAARTLQSQREESLISLLESVIERIDSGVLVLDGNGSVLRLNKMGRRILRDIGEGPVEIIEGEAEPDGDGREYTLTGSNGRYTVIGSLHEVELEPYAKMMIFNDAASLRARGDRNGSAFRQITGISKEIQGTRDRLKIAAASHSCVLIQAENGMGAELYAKAIHDESERRGKPFVTIDCAALPSQAQEEYLFGVASPSNTAGAKGRPGHIEAAEGGTLLLRNIEGLSPAIRQRLVPLLELGRIMRVGSKKQRQVNVRVIASTSRDLRADCLQGDFDRDLYYLISVIPITIPPLRDRREDIRLLAAGFIDRCARDLDKPVAGIDEDFWHSMEAYDWPGNIRELRNAAEYAVNMLTAPYRIHAGLLPEGVGAAREAPRLPEALNLEAAEKAMISQALELCKNGGITREEAAQRLGIGVATLYRKIQRYGLHEPRGVD